MFSKIDWIIQILNQLSCKIIISISFYQLNPSQNSTDRTKISNNFKHELSQKQVNKESTIFFNEIPIYYPYQIIEQAIPQRSYLCRIITKINYETIFIIGNSFCLLPANRFDVKQALKNFKNTILKNGKIKKFSSLLRIHCRLQLSNQNSKEIIKLRKQINSTENKPKYLSFKFNAFKIMFYCQNPFLFLNQGQVLVFYPYYFSESIFPNLCSNWNQNSFIDPIQNEFLRDHGGKQNQNRRQVKDQAQKERINEDLIVESNFEPEQTGRVLFYKNKNTQTNLSNQIFSFWSSNKSRQLIEKLFEKDQRKVEQFYKMMRKIKKSNKKYLNRVDIVNLLHFNKGSPYARFRNMKSKCKLEIEEIRKVLRISVRYFLCNLCVPTFLTSKKINRETLIEHLERKREFIDYIKKHQ